jgi:hypothetical protein
VLNVAREKAVRLVLDTNLLNLKHYQGIEILNARRALERIVASVRRD